MCTLRSTVQSSYVQPAALGRYAAQRKFLRGAVRFRCSISSLHTDNLSLL